MDMYHEPIRLPAWAFAVLLFIGPPIAAYVAGEDWRAAAAAAILSFLASAGVIAKAESVRARTDSPATVDARREVIDGAVFP